MSEDPLLVVGREHLRNLQSETDGDRSFVLEHQARLMTRAAPAFSGAMQDPLALHPEVRMDRCPAVHAEEEVLPTRHDLGEAPAGEVGGREAGNPEVRLREGPALEGGSETLRRKEDGVALRHEVSGRARTV